MDHMEYASKLLSLVKTMFFKRKTFEDIKNQDFDFLGHRLIDKHVIQIFKKRANLTGWMNWDEFRDFYAVKFPDRRDGLDKMAEVINDDDIPLFEGNEKNFFDVVKEFNKDLKVREMQDKIQSYLSADKTEEQFDELIQEVSQTMSEAINTTKQHITEDEEIDVRDIDGMREKMESDYRKIMSGKKFTIRLFDKDIPYFASGQFIVFQAEPKRGKSTIKREIAMMNFCRGLNGIYISTEMQPAENQLLFASLITSTDAQDIYSRKIFEDTDRYENLMTKYQKFLDKNPEGYLKFLHTDGEIDDVKSKILKHKHILESENKTLDYVVLDHILDMKAKSFGKSKSDTERYTYLVQEMYDFGVNNNYITVTSQHLGRDTIKMKGGKPQVPRSGGFGTSAVEKKATLTIILSQTDQQQYNNQISAQIGVTRFGIEGLRATVNTDFKKQRFFATEPVYAHRN